MEPPFYDMREELGGFAVLRAIDDDSVLDIQNAICNARPDLELFSIQRFDQRLAFDLSCARLRDAYGSRTFRAEDYEVIERAIGDAVRHVVGDIQRIVRVERLYGFDWDAAERETIGDLRGRMRQVPGWVEGGDFAAWFSAHEDDVPSLGAAMEPPGLHVFGTLEEARWHSWHEAFMRIARDAPVPVRDDL